jgi:hypothetical protein
MTATQSLFKKILSAIAACIAAVLLAEPRLNLPIQAINILTIIGVLLGVLGASPVATKPTNDTIKKVLSTLAALVGLANGGQLLMAPLPTTWASILGVAGVVLGVFGASPLGRIVWTDPPASPPPVPPPPTTPAVGGAA